MTGIKELQERFKRYAISIVIFAEQLPESTGYRTVRGQIIRSATSSAANYRAAGRGRSTAEFIAKMGIVEEEMDETLFWLEFLVGLSDTHKERVTPLWYEGNELLSIVVTSIKTAKQNR